MDGLCGCRMFFRILLRDNRKGDVMGRKQQDPTNNFVIGLAELVDSNKGMHISSFLYQLMTEATYLAFSRLNKTKAKRELKGFLSLAIHLREEREKEE